MESDRNGTTWRSREPSYTQVWAYVIRRACSLRCSHGGWLFTIFLNIAPEICIAAAPQGLKSILQVPVWRSLLPPSSARGAFASSMKPAVPNTLEISQQRKKNNKKNAVLQQNRDKNKKKLNSPWLGVSGSRYVHIFIYLFIYIFMITNNDRDPQSAIQTM